MSSIEWWVPKTWHLAWFICHLLVRSKEFDAASKAIAEAVGEGEASTIKDSLSQAVREFKLALGHVKKHYPVAKAKAKQKAKAKANSAA